MTQPVLTPVAPPVNVRTIDAREAAEREAQVGSIAPLNTRIIAALIDSLVAAGLQITLAFVLPHFAGRLAWLVAIAYLVTRDSLPFLGGQSVGKKAMKLKAVTMDGKSLEGNWEAAIIRNVAFIVAPLAFVELIVLLTREGKPEHGRRLGDEWAKTKVVVAPDPSTAG